MSRKYDKQKVLQTKPITRKYFVYSRKPGENVVGIIFTLALSGIGIALLFAKQYFPAFFPIFLACLAVCAMITAVQSVSIDGEKLIADYPLSVDIYKVSEIKTVSWHKIFYLRRRPLFYDSYTILCIEMKNGKKVEIPGSPYGRVDMQKTLVAWQEKYTSPDPENIAETD